MYKEKEGAVERQSCLSIMRSKMNIKPGSVKLSLGFLFSCAKPLLCHIDLISFSADLVSSS